MSGAGPAAEQGYLDTLYARLDLLRERAAGQLAAVRRDRSGGTPQNLSERDAFAALYADRLGQLRAVEDRLCFGRLDLRDGQRRYIGRLGLSDEERHQLLVDWRAPAARAFYQATAAAPEDVVRRRHLTTRGREVTAVEDEVLDLDALADADRETLAGEGALLAALNAHRSGRMRDIVATIQAEQDRIIRADLPGVLVVQGGPGTGKTAVALHRAAYLLYTHRDRLAKSGVLIVGPSPTFLRYIEQVLPALGETGVVLSSPAQLLPGLHARGREPEEVAALKGDLRLAEVLAAAVRARQRVPRRAVRLSVDGRVVVLRPDAVAAARARAWRRRRPHNVVRRDFLLDLLGQLAGQLAREERTALTRDNRPDFIAELREAPDVRRELNLLWMPLRPQQLLADLFADPRALAEAAPGLTPAERALLRREREAAWTPADVPLLDEAAELLGEDPMPAVLAGRVQAAERRQELEYARTVVSSSGAGGLVSAERLADRFADTGLVRSVAERAAEDRDWAFGHVVVDEAQELSPMAWRVLMRRCPARSMTVVGDLAQTGSLAGARSWGEVLDPYVEGRWRRSELTVNYRTPRQVMDLATRVLRAAGVPVTPPRSAREGAGPPVLEPVPAGGSLSPTVVRAVRDELAQLGSGRLAVVAPAARYADLAGLLEAELPTGSIATGAKALEAPVSVLTATEAKGLEVDAVVLVEPAEVLAASRLGARDLYVALTRPTQRLRVVHALPLPPGFEP